MDNRYEITFKEGGVDAFETIITGGAAKVVEKVLDTVSGDDNHGWYCTIKDKKTGLKASYWGETKQNAQEKTFDNLSKEVEQFYQVQKEEHEQQKMLEFQKRELQARSSSSNTRDNETSSFITLAIWVVIIGVIIMVVLTAIFLAPIIFLCSYLIKKRQSDWLALLGMLFSIILVFDISSGGYLSIVSNFVFKMNISGRDTNFILLYLAVFSITFGLLIDKYASKNPTQFRMANWFKRNTVYERRVIIAGISAMLFTITVILQLTLLKEAENVNNSNGIVYEGDTNIPNSVSNINYSTNTSLNGSTLTGTWFLSNGNSSKYNFYSNGRGEFFTNNGHPMQFSWSLPSSNLLVIKVDEDNSVWNWNIESFSSDKIVMYSQKHNDRRTLVKNQNNNDRRYTSNNLSNNSSGKPAIITDPDGYTNVRAGKGTETSVIYALQTNENFIVYPSNEEWWKVKLNNGSTGYIFHDRVHILNYNLKGEYPIASNKTLQQQDLKNLSKYELTIMRNEIFARYGYIFNQGGDMDTYFRRTEWYNPRFTDVDNQLTEIEKKNINFIQNYESSKVSEKNGIVNGTNVVIRNGYTTDSKIIGSFKNSGEKVEILDTYNSNSTETLIKREMIVTADNSVSYTLEKGKSIDILSVQNGKARIKFKDRLSNIVTATIRESYIEKSASSNWYLIKRSSGGTGWVYGNFIRINN